MVSRFEMSKKKIRFFETAKVDEPLNAKKSISFDQINIFELTKLS